MEKIIHSPMKQKELDYKSASFKEPTRAETHWKSVLQTDENLLLSC